MLLASKLYFYDVRKNKNFTTIRLASSWAMRTLKHYHTYAFITCNDIYVYKRLCE